jgi:hypothetical protein
LVIVPRRTRTLVDLPVAALAILAVLTYWLVDLPWGWKYVALYISEAVFLGAVLVQFRVIRRVGDTYVTVSARGRKRRPLKAHRLRGDIRLTGGKVPRYHYCLDLVPRWRGGQRDSVPITSVPATEPNLPRIVAWAKLLDESFDENDFEPKEPTAARGRRRK